MLTDGWEYVATDSNHAQVPNLSSPAEIEQCQAYDAYFLVGSGRSTADEAGCVLAGPHLGKLISAIQKM